MFKKIWNGVKAVGRAIKRNWKKILVVAAVGAAAVFTAGVAAGGFAKGVGFLAKVGKAAWGGSKALAQVVKGSVQLAYNKTLAQIPGLPKIGDAGATFSKAGNTLKTAFGVGPKAGGPIDLIKQSAVHGTQTPSGAYFNTPLLNQAASQAVQANAPGVSMLSSAPVTAAAKTAAAGTPWMKYGLYGAGWTGVAKSWASPAGVGNILQGVGAGLSAPDPMELYNAQMRDKVAREKSWLSSMNAVFGESSLDEIDPVTGQKLATGTP